MDKLFLMLVLFAVYINLKTNVELYRNLSVFVCSFGNVGGSIVLIQLWPCTL